MNELLQSPGDQRDPFFSIALPAYNAASTLDAAIQSVRDQHFGSWELIVVDDGSTDDTLEVARAHTRADSRIQVISQPNAGCGAARNTAVEHARAEWIVRFDADDLLLPDFLGRISEVIADFPGAEIVSPSGLQRDAEGQDRTWCPDPRYREPFDYSLDDALHGWCPVFTHSAFRHDLWERIGGIRSDCYTEDYDFWVRALAAGASGRFFPESLSVYMVGNTGRMSDRGNRLAASYLDTLERISDGHTLTPVSQAAVEARIEQLRRRVAFRSAASKVLGERGSERLSNVLVKAVGWSRRQRARFARRRS